MVGVKGQEILIFITCTLHQTEFLPESPVKKETTRKTWSVIGKIILNWI
jgi:hypothetical protein